MSQQGQGSVIGLAQLARGFQFPAVGFEISREWVREYLAAVEDEASVGLGEEVVPSMAVAALAIRSLLASLELPPGAVHVGQELEFLRLVKAGERLATQAQVTSSGERQGWALVAIDMAVADEGGAPVMKGRSMVTAPLS